MIEKKKQNKKNRHDPVTKSTKLYKTTVHRKE